METGKEEEFRVIDRRGRTDQEEAPTSAGTARGDGFIMQEKTEQAAGPEEIDFATLVYSFATSAMIHLGRVQDPKTSKPTEVNLPVAKQNIDILAMLQTKTKGNLSADESAMIEHFVTELRLLFVEAAKSSK